MKKILLLDLVVLMAISFLYTSCKKTDHPNRPTPANSRLLSYTKLITPLIPTDRPVNKSYTFYYDNQNRVSQILYSSNDSAQLLPGVPDISHESITFNYSGNTIIKTTTSLYTGVIVEIDTFQTNQFNQITQANMPGYQASFSYLGKLIGTKAETFYGTQIKYNVTTTYTSDNEDLLNNAFDGNVHVTFTDLTPPIDAGYAYYTTVLTHNGVGNNDVVSGYSGYGLVAGAQDVNGNIDGPFLLNTGLWTKEAYKVYPDLTNGPGDFLQIESFTTFGVNIYANTHLVKQIIGTGTIPALANIVYTIDAYSRVTQTSVTGYGFDTVAASTIYKMQYETY